jgi:hypothetical protein
MAAASAASASADRRICRSTRSRAAYLEYYRESEQVSRSSAIAARDRVLRQIRLSADADAADAAAIADAADASEDVDPTDLTDPSDATDIHTDTADVTEATDDGDAVEPDDDPGAEPGRSPRIPPSLRRLAPARARALVKAALDRGARPSAG